MTSLSNERLATALSPSPHSDFRPDIEGLRAIAVLLVLLYHAGFKTISGGFIGVDIFFVISGFLITSIIQRKIASSSFSILEFYSRRLKRIAPALITVILTTAIACYFVLLPDDLVYFTRSAASALLSVSNFLFWSEASEYFSQSTEQIPLIHTWSLAVEEQFYIFLPLALLATSKKSTKIKLLFLAAAFFASLCYSVWAAKNDPISAYFLLPSRAFELLIGAATAMSWSLLPTLSAAMSNVIRVISLSVITFVAFSIDKTTQFPGLAALAPCVATAAIIYAGKVDKTYSLDTARILDNWASTYVGKISYSLYLWHWPIIAILHYKGYQLDPKTSVSIIAASFALSILTFYAIEQPFRKSSAGFSKTASMLWLAPLAAAMAVSLTTTAYDGFKFRFSDELAGEFASTNSPGVKYKQCFNSYLVDNFSECSFGDVNSHISGVLLGDSMAGHYIPFIDVIAKDAGVKVFATASSGLPPFNVKNYPMFKQQRSEEALNYNDRRIEESYKYENVYIAASWAQGYPYLSENEADLFSSIERYIKKGIKVTLIARPNTLSVDAFNDLKTKRLAGENISLIRVPIKDSNLYLRKIKEKFPSIQVIDPNRILCTPTDCSASIGSRIAYQDYAHLNNYSSSELAKKYIQEFGNPLLNSQ